MQIDIITVFPEFFYSPLSTSITRQARESGFLKFNIINLRDFTQDKHKSVDDYPYGGGAGMILKPEPLARAIESCLSSEKDNKAGLVIYLTPDGKTFNNECAGELAKSDHLIFVCGHYEGIDERIRELYVDMEISIGDYVLTGGELPVLVVMDTVMRFLPGVLGNKESAANESFSDGLLEYPQFTRPAEFRGRKVPKVLLSGNHKVIEKWQKEQSLKKTLKRRPELIDESKFDSSLLQKIKKEISSEGKQK